MRVLVAGSSGLIGTALVPHLREAGHEVLRLVRRTPAAPDERGWDPPAGTLADGALDGVGAVVNLCGASLGGRRWSHSRKQVLIDSRTEPTEVLATAVAEHKVPVLVNGSAVGYYGDTGDTEVDESAPSGGGFLAELCRRWEDATAPARDAGARVVRLRSAVVLSSAGGILGSLRPLFGFALGGRLGEGTQYMPWIQLDDHVAAIRHTLDDDGLSGPVNLAAPEQATNARFTKEFARALRRPAPWVVPKFALRFGLGELADEMLLSGQRVAPSVLADAGFEYRYPTLADALASTARR